MRIIIATLLGLVGAAAAQSAAFDAMVVEHRYYLGTVGDGAVQMELRLEGPEARGWYFYERIGTYIDLRGTLSDGVLRLEESVEGVPTGRFEAEIPWSPQGVSTLSGRWHAVDGRTLPFRLTRAAEYGRLALTQGVIEARRTLPFFTGDAHLDLNAELQLAAFRDLQDFFASGQALLLDDALYFGWSYDERTTIRFLSDDLVSALSTLDLYTGGAHPNTHYRTVNRWRVDGTFRDIVVTDLFDPDSGYLERLSELVLAQLSAAGASSVVGGSITALGESDLDVFELAPDGLTFAFAPYRVASYAEGSFFVTVPLEELLPYAAPDGPLAPLFEARGLLPAR